MSSPTAQAGNALETPERYVTADEFEAMPDHSGFELIDGKLVERKMGNEAFWVSGEIFALIRDHARSNDLGWAYPTETVYRCFGEKADRVRKADASLISKGRLPNERPPVEDLRIAPDLVVEVVSPTDIAYDVEEKVRDYLNAGVRLIWVVYPSVRTVRVFHADGRRAELTAEHEIDGGDVLPGFKARIASFFPPVPQT